MRIAMKTFREAERPAGTSLSPRRIVIRHAHNAVDAEKLLPLAVLERLYAGATPSQVRRSHLYSSRVIVALVGDSTVGFAAYRTAAAPVRIAHEFAVDARARVGLATVAEALLKRLEFVVTAAECSQLVVVLPESTPLRPLLERSGYRVSHGAVDQIWFEKRLAGAGDGAPLESA
jgi:hypothetical protein